MHSSRMPHCVDNKGMSQHGDQRSGQEDAWWGELYGRSELDTEAVAAGDSLDERFSSASAVVGPEPKRPRGEPRRPRVDARPAPPPGRPSASPGSSASLSPARSRGVPRQARWSAADGGLPAPAQPPAPAPPPPPPEIEQAPEPPAPTGPERDPAPRQAAPPPPDPRTRVSPPPETGAPETGESEPVASESVPPESVPSETGAPKSEASKPPAPRPPAVTAEQSGAPQAPGTPARAEPRRATGALDRDTRDLTGPPPALPDVYEAPGSPAVQSTHDTTDVSETPPAAPLPAPARRGGNRARAAEFVGRRPPTYEAEPTLWPPAEPSGLDGLVPDTVLDGARYGAMTLRAVSLRGDSARYRGEPRRDALLTARFGDGDDALLLVAMASGARAAEGSHRAARDVCEWIGGAVGRSHARLAEDLRSGRRDELKSGLHRLTDRAYGRLRARAAKLGRQPSEHTAALRCLLLPADDRCRTRVFFGVGGGGLFRLRDGAWQDLDPERHEAEPAGEPVVGYGSGDRSTVDLGIPTPGTAPVVDPEEVPGEPFRFRASIARPGDTLLLCSAGLAEPLRGEPELGVRLAERWSQPEPPGLAVFLADAQLRVKGYADDRTACAVWEA